MVKPLVMLLLCLLPFSMGACAASSHPEGSPSLSAPVPSAPPSAASSPMPQPSAAQPVQIQIQVGDSPIRYPGGQSLRKSLCRPAGARPCHRGDG